MAHLSLFDLFILQKREDAWLVRSAAYCTQEINHLFFMNKLPVKLLGACVQFHAHRPEQFTQFACDTRSFQFLKFLSRRFV